MTRPLGYAGCARTTPGAAHHHFAGASLGIAAATYREVGGLEPRRRARGRRLRRQAGRAPGPGPPRGGRARADLGAAGGPRSARIGGRHRGLRLGRASALPRRGFSAAPAAAGEGRRLRRRDRARPRSAPRRWPRYSAARLAHCRRAGLVDEVVVVDAASAGRHGAVRRRRRSAGPAAGRAASRLSDRPGERATRCGAPCTRPPERSSASSTATPPTRTPTTSAGCSGRCSPTRRCSWSRARSSARCGPARSIWPTREAG